MIDTWVLMHCSGPSIFQMHSDDFRKDTHGVVSGLRDGGYSDDMTLAAIAGNVSVRLRHVFM